MWVAKPELKQCRPERDGRTFLFLLIATHILCLTAHFNKREFYVVRLIVISPA